jgi:hypothetical protein
MFEWKEIKDNPELRKFFNCDFYINASRLHDNYVLGKDT